MGHLAYVCRYAYTYICMNTSINISGCKIERSISRRKFIKLYKDTTISTSWWYTGRRTGRNRRRRKTRRRERERERGGDSDMKLRRWIGVVYGEFQERQCHGGRGVGEQGKSRCRYFGRESFGASLTQRRETEGAGGKGGTRRWRERDRGGRGRLEGNLFAVCLSLFLFPRRTNTRMPVNQYDFVLC